ncbi:penicillin-binding transpeptidase domain-containing protein [Bacillus salacetis]|uniref:penicillin-binding transpeptidase domain-containing protein n=1 Tax=Bacillus salacetis TaxID=2315464 RepID=UPI003BA27FAA
MKKLAFILIFLSLTFITGCQEKPQPDDRLEAYISLWNKQDFAKMYNQYLSEKAKTTFSTEDFIERYKDLYTDLEVKNLQVTYIEPEEEQDWEDKDNAKLPVEIKMTTIAGDIQYKKEVELVKETKDEKENWYLKWEPSLILPDLEKGDKVRIQTILAQRGEIFDRNGNPLAMNGQAYQIGVVPEQFAPEDIEKTARLLDITPEYINSQMNQSWVKPEHFVPLKKIPLDNRELAVEVTSIDGLFSKEVDARVYPYAEVTAHLIGFTGKVTAEDLEELKGKGYTGQSVIGKRGLEELYQEKLRGQNGQVISIEKEDGSNQNVAMTEVENGESIMLAIDADMQRALYEQMQNEAGTATAIDPNTGEVLSLLSVPSFDPNDFSLGISTEKRAALQEDPNKPLLNRFASTYSPGSTLKPITAAIGLKSGELDPAKTYAIPAKQWQKDNSWGGYFVTRFLDDDTSVDLEDAIKFSDNIYFARAGLDMGADTFQQGLKNFGFEEDLPFAYPIRSSQIANEGEIEGEIQLADSAYGQGQILMSVLHLANSFGAIVNDGIMMKPLLLDGAEKEVWKNELLTKDQAELLKTNLRKVVTEGIAGKAAVDGRAIAGKTGTAEIKSEQGTTGTENGLFVSYDQSNPEFVLAMLLENVENRGGSTHTVQVAKEFYQSW